MLLVFSPVASEYFYVIDKWGMITEPLYVFISGEFSAARSRFDVISFDYETEEEGEPIWNTTWSMGNTHKHTHTHTLMR